LTNLRSFIISTKTLTISKAQAVIAIAIPSTVAFQDALAIPLPMEHSKAETMMIQKVISSRATYLIESITLGTTGIGQVFELKLTKNKIIGFYLHFLSSF
jgi:hypothetical protein